MTLNITPDSSKPLEASQLIFHLSPTLLVISGSGTGDHHNAHDRDVKHLNVLQNSGDSNKPAAA